MMVMKTMRNRWGNVVDHELRSDLFLRRISEGRMEGRKVVGRPRMKLIECMLWETDGRTDEDLNKLTLDRK
jgi:hypothetical protein